VAWRLSTVSFRRKCIPQAVDQPDAKTGPARERVSQSMRLRAYLWMVVLVAVDALVLVGCGKGKY
jgi:hypothetical protein